MLRGVIFKHTQSSCMYEVIYLGRLWKTMTNFFFCIDIATISVLSSDYLMISDSMKDSMIDVVFCICLLSTFLRSKKDQYLVNIKLEYIIKPLFISFSFSSIKVWIQDFAFARQALYCLSHFSSPKPCFWRGLLWKISITKY
jgi:hypothetical protein